MSETLAFPFITVEGKEYECHGEDEDDRLGFPAGGRP